MSTSLLGCDDRTTWQCSTMVMCYLLANHYNFSSHFEHVVLGSIYVQLLERLWAYSTRACPVAMFLHRCKLVIVIPNWPIRYYYITQISRSCRSSDCGRTTVACSRPFAWARFRQANTIYHTVHQDMIYLLCTDKHHVVKEFASFRISCRVLSRPLSPIVCRNRRTPAPTSASVFKSK